MILSGCDAVHIRHVDVHQHNPWMQRLGKLNSRIPIFSLPDDRKPVFSAKHQCQALAHDLVVVYKQDSNSAIHFCVFVRPDVAGYYRNCLNGTALVERHSQGEARALSRRRVYFDVAAHKADALTDRKQAESPATVSWLERTFIKSGSRIGNGQM